MRDVIAFLTRSLVFIAVLLGTPFAVAGYDFGTWPAGKSPAEVGKRVAGNFVARPHLAMWEQKYIHYAEACTWFGAFQFAQVTHDDALRAQLVARLEPLFGSEKNLVPEPFHVDGTVFAIVPLEAYLQTHDPRALELGQRMADRQWEGEPYGPRFAKDGDKAWKENVAAGLSWQTRFWIDDMFMITMTQSQAYRATGERRYIERAALEAVAYLDRLQRPNGLFYHAPEAPHHWARGNGWMAVGMAELLRNLPPDSPHRPRILTGFRAMMTALLANQDESGMWHQLIDGPDSYPETSGTAMFTYAFITGVQLGVLDEKTYGPAARKGWLALVGYLDDNANLREVCAGTGTNTKREHYLKRPRIAGDFHGQAPLLWCAAALLR